MKKSVFIIILMAVVVMAKAQQPQSPLFFHNHLEYTTYLMEHPDNIPLHAPDVHRGDYSLKLDSVMGSDNFDWTRWKNVYTYPGESDYSNDIRVETSYEWQNQAWMPTYMSEIFLDSVLYSRWTDEGWEMYHRVLNQYTECNGILMLENVTYEFLDADRPSTLYTYEYDENCNLVLLMIYEQDPNTGEWIENSKYDYSYNEQGSLTNRVLSTIRNGSWRESQKDTLVYNDQHQCVSLLARRKGGWGPMANQWMDSYRYEFEYEDGNLVSELYYGATGWFGGTLSFSGKTEYAFDANGNENLKTTSIFNEQDWIVRDLYENQFDLSVDANAILGLAPIWESTLNQGMGFVLGSEMPLNNKWLGCSIVSDELDTEFTLYYSGFAAVEEHQDGLFEAFSHDGRLIVESDTTTDVVVYDLLGRVVASKTQVQCAEFELKPGLYIVGNGSRRVKAMVR